MKTTGQYCTNPLQLSILIQYLHKKLVFDVWKSSRFAYVKILKRIARFPLFTNMFTNSQIQTIWETKIRPKIDEIPLNHGEIKMVELNEFCIKLSFYCERSYKNFNSTYRFRLVANYDRGTRWTNKYIAARRGMFTLALVSSGILTVRSAGYSRRVC